MTTACFLGRPLEGAGRARQNSRSAAAPIFLPHANHSYVVDNSDVNDPPIWWEVRPVLILDQRDWPAADGSRGIASARAMDAAERAGRGIEVGSNFFLLFSLHHMPGMERGWARQRERQSGSLPLQQTGSALRSNVG
jgi:hypothetical protein